MRASDSDASKPTRSSSSNPSSPLATQTLAPIPDADLPLPTAPRPFTTKKSHARKQPAGHIPRPRNAFILFRCDYSQQRQNAKGDLDQSQNDLSRAVGQMWRRMTVAQRAPWVILAEEEKQQHAVMYPGYKYMPRNRKAPPPTEESVQNQFVREAERVVAVEKQRRKEEEEAESLKGTVTIYYPPWATRRYKVYYARRATSCPPPGAVSVSPYSETLNRARLSIRTKTEPPSQKGTDMFLPLLEVSPEPEPPWSVHADDSLSRHTIDPPDGTHWGIAPRAPADYRMQGNLPMVPQSEVTYVPHQHPQTYSESSYRFTAPDPSSPDPSSSSSSGSTTPSPMTPTYVEFAAPAPVRVYTNPLASSAPEPEYPDFVAEFGTMCESLGTASCYPSAISPRESSERTTYTNAYDIEMDGYE